LQEISREGNAVQLTDAVQGPNEGTRRNGKTGIVHSSLPVQLIAMSIAQPVPIVADA